MVMDVIGGFAIPDRGCYSCYGFGIEDDDDDDDEEEEEVQGSCASS